MKRYICIFMVLVPLLFAACGGGGGGESVVSLKTNHLRLDEPGDYWTHYTTFDIDDVSSPAFTVTGDVITTNLAQLVQNPYNLDECIDGYYFGNLSGQIIEGHSYYLQDINGSYYYYGDEDGWIINPASGYVLSTLSPMALNQTHSYSYSLDNSDTYSGTYLVQTIDEVSGPLGTYEAYRVVSTGMREYADGSSFTSTSTSWIVPGLGLIRRESTANYYDEFDDFYRYAAITEVLVETNVSY